MVMKMKIYSLLLLAGMGLGATPTNIAQTSTATTQVRVHEQRAHQLLTEKKPDLAAKEFAAVLAADPHNLDAQANLGVLLYFQKNYAGAEPHLRAALEQQPHLMKIRALLGMCERRLGETEPARTDLEAVLGELDDASVEMEVGLELIEMDTAAHDLVRAASALEILRRKSPADSRVLYAAYRIYTDLAGEALIGLSVAAPESGQMDQAIAHELLRQRDVNGAITDYRKALAADPNLPGVHFELAEALRSSPDLKLRAEAEEQYNLALAANPADEKVMIRLGDLEADRGDLDGAAKRYDDALKIVPNDPDALLGRARVYTEKNEAATALPLLERVVADDPSNMQAHYRLSVAYRKLKRPEDAKRELQAYQRYKAMKEKLRQTYKDLRLENDTADPEKDGRE
jgi:Tfp pilus assembly protein PilF